MPEDTPATPAAPRSPQPRNPLHGLTLEAIVKALVAYFGWQGLAEQIPVRCFSHEPSVASSLKFLRRTPWAREKVESLYLFMLREQARSRKHAAQWPAPTPEPLSLEPSEPPEAPSAGT